MGGNKFFTLITTVVAVAGYLSPFGTILAGWVKPSAPQRFVLASEVTGEIPGAFHFAQAPPEAAETAIGLERATSYTNGTGVREEQVVVGQSRDGEVELLDGSDPGIVPSVALKLVRVDQDYLGVQTSGQLARTAGAMEATMISIPERGFTADILCTSEAHNATRLAELCEQVAATLAFHSPDVPATTLKWLTQNASTLDSTMTRYSAELVKLRSNLAHAKTASGQARLANRLGVLCRGTAVKLEHLKPDPIIGQDEMLLSAALSSCHKAYDSLSDAIVSNEQRRADRAEKTILDADKRISMALLGLSHATMRFQQSGPSTS